MKGSHDLCEVGDEQKENITKYLITGDFLNVEARIFNMGRSSQENDVVFGCSEIQGTLKSLLGGTNIDNAGSIEHRHYRKLLLWWKRKEFWISHPVKAL